MLLFVIVSLAIVQSAVIPEEQATEACDGIKVNGVYHDKEILKNDLDRPYLLTVDYDTNTLYFSYSVKGLEEEVFKTAHIDLKSNEFDDIDDVPNGFAQTVDQETHQIYIGAEGLYKYDINSDKAEIIGENETNIWTVYFKDNVLYYSTFPTQFLYTFIDGKSEKFKDLEDTKVDHFVIDGEDVMFYTNATGLYAQKKGTKDAVLYMEFAEEGVRGLTTDKNNVPFVCTRDVIYAIHKDTASLEKIADIDDGFGIAFDAENNIIYSNATAIIRLLTNENKNCE